MTFRDRYRKAVPYILATYIVAVAAAFLYFNMRLTVEWVAIVLFGAALFLRGSVDKRHFADVADSVLYWFFVVLIWMPLYFILYVAPRVL